jgi:DNA-binding transcriptional LysR family regulator
MELRQIRSFLSIAETLSFVRSAEMIHLSQPALSLQIKALEEELGVRLLERNRRRTILTAAGIAFHEDVAGVLVGLDQAIQRAKLAAVGRLGLLRIGFISTAANEIVPGIIREFRELHPQVEFSLRNILPMDQIQMLNNGTIDIGFLRLPISEHWGLEVVPVHQERFVLVVPASHKLAKRKRVRLNELANQDFVMYERKHAPGFHDLLLGILRDAGIVPKVCQIAGEMPTLIALVDSGAGIAILPASAVRKSTTPVVVCEIADNIPMSEIGLAVRKASLSAIVTKFRDFALATLIHPR